MNYIFLIISLFTAILANGQSNSHDTYTGNAIAGSDQKISTGQAALQSAVWEQKTAENKNDADAWFNYYLWTERNKASGETQTDRPEKIVKEASGYINQTWQLNLMVFIQSGKKDITALLNALKLSGRKEIIYPYIIQYAIIKDDKPLLKEYTAALNKKEPLTAAEYEYHYNTLMSAEENAVIYAKGLNDLVPLAVLQQQFNIRKDLRLKYYDDKIITDNDAYLCISSGRNVLEKYPEASCTGLLIKVKPESDLRNLENNFEEKFKTSVIENDSIRTEEESALYKNYLPGFIILYRSYRKKNPGKAAVLKSLIMKISMKAGNNEIVNEMLAQ